MLRRPAGALQPFFLILAGLSSIVLGFYAALMQSVYPSPPYLQGVMNSFILDRTIQKLNIYVAYYVLMVIISMSSIVVLAGMFFFSPFFPHFLKRWLTGFRIAAAAIFLSIGFGLLYLLNQPFLGG